MIFKKKGIMAPPAPPKPKGISVDDVKRGRDQFDMLVNDAIDQRQVAIETNEEMVLSLVKRSKELEDEQSAIQIVAGIA